MKALLNILTVFITSSAFAELTNGIDYNRGICVQAGRELSKENAVLIIEGARINGHPPVLSRDHNFFDPNFGPSEIKAINWGGTMLLRKIKASLDGTFYASYENHLHGNEIDPISVLCVAQSFIYEGAFDAKGKAKFYPWSTFDYCAEARSATDVGAQEKCAPAKAKRISVYTEFPGGDTICRVEARYVCK